MDNPISKEVSINEKVANKTGRGIENSANHHDNSLLSSTGSSSSDEESVLNRKMDFLSLRSDVSENSSSNFLTNKNGQNLILKLLKNEEIREKKAKAFISHLIVNKMMHIESVLTEEKLLSWYDSFSEHDCSALLSSKEILSTLRSIDVIKFGDAVDPLCKDADNNIVHFKDHVFLNRNNGENELPNAIEIHRLRSEEKLVEKSEFNCKMCRQNYDNPENLDNHYSSKIHILKKLHRNNRSWFASKIENLEVDKPEKINMDTNERKSIEITFKNVSEHYDIHISEIFELVDLEEVKTEYSSKCRIEKNETFKIMLDVNFKQYGARIFPIVIILFLENNCEEFKYLLIEPTFNVTSRKINTTIPKQPYRRIDTGTFPKKPDERRCIILDEKPKPSRRCIILDTSSVFGRGRSKTTTAKKEDPKTKWGFRNAGRGARKLMTLKTSDDDKKEVISAPRIARELDVPKLNLPPNEIPPSLNALFKIGFKTISNFSVIGSDIVKKFQRLICEPDGSKVLSNETILNMENYTDRFHFIMWMEEYQAIQEIRSFDQHNIFLITNRKNEKLMGIELPGLAEGRPSVLKGDTVIITPKGYVKKFEGVVEVVGENSIYVKMDNKFFIENLWKHQVSVNFRFNRTPLRMSHKTLDDIKHLRMDNIIFPTSCEEDVKSVQLKPFFNKSIEGNELQIQAINNILENRAYPAPYILFGPPGTGKTATLVEAITQLWSTFNDSRICVCASSNTAADVIASRLLNYIPMTDIIRIYGLSRSDSEIISDLQNCCNFDPTVGEVYFPSINELRNKRVVVMTPVTAGRLVLSGIHFDYLFMDEAGHTVEVEMMIPIVGFLKKNISQRISGSLILAGDPKQLGPVVRSPSAIEAGFGISLLERLMLQCDLYKKDPETSKYNPKVITKLVNNYRSHDKILHIPNLRFYDNELLAKASVEKISCLCQWKMLPSANFPVIFHSVKGKEERESNSPSYFNTQEIDIVEKYVRDIFDSKEVKIDESDIGIISPYRKQVHKIRQRLGKLWSNINVASVEEFQGQERKIIIISTVRSRHELVATDYKYGLGFLKNEKRFNVAITRAMALLIVIGNPDILQCDPNWRAFIEYCNENSAFIGESPSGTLPSNFDASELLEDFAHLKL